MTLNAYIWSIDADADHSTLKSYASSLSVDERARADQYRFAHDRRRFMLARGFLRDVLAQHLGAEAANVDLVAQPGAKPRIKQPSAHNAVRFSLTHSSGRIAVGITSQREIGVDVESARSRVDFATLAANVFSPAELQQWQAMDTASRAERFYTAWTRKEALGKALGTGISHGPDTIAVPLDPLHHGQWLSAGSQRWLMSEFPVPNDCFSSLVIERRAGEKFSDRYTDKLVNRDERALIAGTELAPPSKGVLLIRRFTLID